MSDRIQGYGQENLDYDAAWHKNAQIFYNRRYLENKERIERNNPDASLEDLSFEAMENADLDFEAAIERGDFDPDVVSGILGEE